MTSGLTIGRLAEEVGVNIQTIRYYERLNLVNPAIRRPSGYRVYGNEELHRLHFIKNAQTLGFTLREVAELLNLRVNSRACRGDVQRKAANKLAMVEARISDLQRLARSLRRLIRACRAGRPTDRCPILASLEDEGKRLGKSRQKG